MIKNKLKTRKVRVILFKNIGKIVKFGEKTGKVSVYKVFLP